MVSRTRRKKKGINAEREIVHLLWNSGWAAARVAGSGNIKIPAPDVIAGKDGKVIVIECKVVEKLPKYFTFHEIMELKEFAERLKAKAFVAVKILHRGWFLLEIQKLRKTDKAFVMDEDNLKFSWKLE